MFLQYLGSIENEQLQIEILFFASIIGKIFALIFSLI